MGIKIAICNKKGGVGKTSVASNLAAGLAEKGYKVLAVDTDSQANLSRSYGINEYSKGLYHLIREIALEGEYGAQTLSEVLHKNLYGVDVIPPGPMNKIDLELGGVTGREKLLLLLEDLFAQYDVVIFDCSPSITLGTIQALTASHGGIVPVRTETLSVVGLQQFITEVESEVAGKLGPNPDFKIVGIVVVGHTGISTISKSLYEFIESNVGKLKFKTDIAQNVAVQEAQFKGMPVLTYDPDCRASQCFRSLSDEFIERFAS